MSTSNKKVFLGTVCFDDKGEMSCFCHEADVKNNRCVCKIKYDLPEVRITIEPVVGTRPSEQNTSPGITRKVKVVESHLKKLSRESNEIKKSLQNLEKAAKNIRFRI